MTAEPATPAEAILLDDEAGADLKSKVSEAWQDFARSLASELPRLPVGTSLDLTLDPTASGTGDAVYEVTVTMFEAGELLGAAVGNAHLPEGYRLDRTAIGQLVALGWSPPGVVEGAGDSFGVRLPVSDASRLAVIVSRTMLDVYGAPHPAFLTSLLKTTPDALSVAPDGDIGIRSGSAMVFVRVRDHPPLVAVFSPVLTEIQPT